MDTPEPQIAGNDKIIMLARMGQSPFNRSIWQGFARAFRALGCRVFEVDARQVPLPGSLDVLPDLFFAVHGGTIPPEVVNSYQAKGITTAVYLLDEPYEVDRSCQWSRLYDWVFSVDRITVPIHARHSRAIHLPLGFDREIFSPDGPGIPSEILLLGSPYGARSDLLQPILSKWAERITWVGPRWKKFCAQGTHYSHFVTPEICARFYRGAKIIINIHRDSLWSHFGNLNQLKLEATHLNPRFWEAAACGSCQLCTPRKDLAVYAPQTRVFETAEQLDNELQFLLDNPAAREDNARNVYESIRSHSYDQRARQVLEAIIGRQAG